MRSQTKKAAGLESGGSREEALFDAGFHGASAIESLTHSEAEALYYEWSEWVRDNQHPPEGAWANWLILAGRGFGKTRVGAEMVRRWVKNFRLVNLIGATADDARDIMIEGESGILAICPRQERPRYLPSKMGLCLQTGNACQSLRTPSHVHTHRHFVLNGDRQERRWIDLEIG